MDRKLLTTLAPKLGITCPKVHRKSEELMRLYESKSHCSGLQLNANCKVVILLDLAASSLGQPIEKKEAIRLSGVTKTIYSNSFKALEALLGLQSRQSLADLCVQFGCNEAKDLAIAVWKRYRADLEKKTGDCDAVNTQSALFTGAALVAACRKLKVKVDKTKLMELGGVKRAVFDKLLAEMDKIVSTIESEKTQHKVAHRKRPKTLMDRLEDITNDTDLHACSTGNDEMDNESESKPDFEEWKRKILEKASQAMAQK